VIQNEIIPKLKETAQAKGVAVLDLWTGYQAYQKLTPDGVVPNAAGLDTLAHILFRAYKTAPTAVVGPAPGSPASVKPQLHLAPWEAQGRDALGRRARIPQESRPPRPE
jgi:hypothetical protein